MKEHEIMEGDKVVIRQEKTTVKPPYDPKPYSGWGKRSTNNMQEGRRK